MVNLPLDSKINQEMDYLLAGQEIEIYTVASAKITKELHDTYSDVFSSIGWLKGTLSLHVKEGTKPYQALPRHVLYAL